MRMLAGQLDIDVATVRQLVGDQFPRWLPLPIRALASTGTVNAIFRIGDGLVARFPLQPADVEETRRCLEAEASAARELVGALRFSTPVPVAIGQPGVRCPLPWTVNTWVPGIAASEQDPGDSWAYARDLAELVQALRAVDTRGRTFHGSGRGGDLQSHDPWMQECIESHPGAVDADWLDRTWAALRTLPRSSSDAMTHGDLIPGNLLVTQGRLTGVIDVGGFGAGDPALDLVCAWHGLTSGPRQVFREIVGCDDLEWARGVAWAFEQAVGVLWYGATNPTMSAMGARTLARIAADFPM